MLLQFFQSPGNTCKLIPNNEKNYIVETVQDFVKALDPNHASFMLF